MDETGPGFTHGALHTKSTSPIHNSFSHLKSGIEEKHTSIISTQEGNIQS